MGAPVHHAPVHHAPVHHAPAPHHGAGYHEPHYEPAAAHYSYEYGVTDEYGLNFGAGESRDGYATKGQYHVQLPDGRLQTVTYHVDDAYSGYVADVQYSGKSHYEPAHHAPAHHAPVTMPPFTMLPSTMLLSIMSPPTMPNLKRLKS